MSDRRTGVNGWWLLASVAAVGAVLLSVGSMHEVDLFWHIRVGEFTLHGQRFPHPDPFAFTLPHVHWHSTQWLAEVVIAKAYDVEGFGAIVALRLVLVCGLLTALFRLLVRRSDSWTGPAVFAMTAIPLTEFVQDRPALASLLFLCWLAGVVDRSLVTGVAPARWRFVVVTYLWATIHGLFVLAPGLLFFLAVLSWRSPDEVRRRSTKSFALTALLTTAACAATPMGPRLLLAPITVANAARSFVVEWAPTNVLVFGALSLYLLLSFLLAASSRAASRRPIREILYVAAVGAFGLLAIRNVGPASILLAPVAVRWADAAWPTPSTIVVPRRLVAGLTALGVGVALLTQLGKPVVERGPEHITRYLASEPEGVRVLDDYNLSGYLLLHAPNIRVAVDGRADRYGQDFLKRYADAIRGAPTWKSWVTSLHPDLAVLHNGTALPELMRVELGWRVVMKDQEYLLLAPPRGAGA